MVIHFFHTPWKKNLYLSPKTLSVWLSLTGSFFYDIMNVHNPSTDFGNRFLFGAILRIDRFVFTQTVFFYAQKKAHISRTTEMSFSVQLATEILITNEL